MFSIFLFVSSASYVDNLDNSYYFFWTLQMD